MVTRDDFEIANARGRELQRRFLGLFQRIMTVPLTELWLSSLEVSRELPSPRRAGVGAREAFGPLKN